MDADPASPDPLRRGVVRCGLAALLFGASTPAAATLGDRLTPFTLAGLLYLGAALAMIPFVVNRWPGRAATVAGAGRLAVPIVAGGMAGPVLLMFALSRAPASSVALLLNFEVVFTVFLARAVFQEHLGPRVVAGAAAVAAAGALLGWSSDVTLRAGALYAVLACACWAVDNTITARLDTFTPAQITLAKGIVAGSVNLLIGVAAGGHLPAAATAAALAVGGVGYGASIMLWISGARELGAARGQIIFAAAPFVGAVLSWLVLHEAVHGTTLAAGLLAAAGVGLVLRSSHRHLHRHEPQAHEHEHDHLDPHHTHGHGEPAVGSHTHLHRHQPLEHRHPHVPDLHHRHRHRH